MELLWELCRMSAFGLSGCASAAGAIHVFFRLGDRAIPLRLYLCMVSVAGTLFVQSCFSYFFLLQSGALLVGVPGVPGDFAILGWCAALFSVWVFHELLQDLEFPRHLRGALAHMAVPSGPEVGDGLDEGECD